MKCIASQQLIDIIIKAKDQASSTADKVDQKLKKFGDNASKANEKATKAAQKFDQALINTGQSFQVVGSGAAQAANVLGQMKLDPNFGSSINQAKLKVSQMGYDINSVQGKLRVFGEAVPLAFNKLRTSVGNAATSLKGKLGSAIDSVKQKLTSLASGANRLGSVFGALKGAASMMVGMIGYDLFNGLIQSARASINAASQVEYFGQRLNKMTGETHLSSQKFQEFKGQLGELQQEFRKVDMTAVGATAEELAVKMNLPANKLKDLTRMTAVMSSTFVKEGRSQEDAVLAVSDALDGQFKRLQEIGISQQMLIDNGWSGDIEDQTTLIDALNKTMADMGYEQTAKDITNLDEAWTALTIAGGQLMQKVLVPITPIIIKGVDAFLRIADAVGDAINAFKGLPDWATVGAAVAGVGLAIVGLATAIELEMLPALTEFVAGMAASTLAAWEFVAAMLANPLTWVVIALAAVAVAVYEVGKAFGWWTDVNSMLAAVWAGIQRLWSAFINHPDVQGLINGIRWAWQQMQPYIQSVVSWVLSFFTASSNSNFDAVRALINAVSVAWKSMTLPIRTLITVVKLLWNAIKQWYTTTKNNVDKVRALFRALPGWIRGAISSLVSVITAPFRNAYNGVVGAVDRIKSYVKGLTKINLSGITNAITKPFTDAYNRVCDEVEKIKRKASELTGGIFTFGGEDLVAYGGTDLETNVYSKGNDEVTVNMKQDLNLVLDLRNVPESIDETTLHTIVVDTITSKPVLESIARNNDFQMMDNKVKARIISKNNRARGV